MPDQNEVPSNGVASERASGAATSGPAAIAGVPVTRIVILAAAAGALVWGAWATKGITDLRSAQTHIVKARLTEVVTGYVQAAARSNSPPEVAAQQTATFLKVLNDTVNAHAANGQVVLLANAVVAGDVPDITDQIQTEVYAKVPKPAAASPGEVQSQMRQFMSSNQGQGAGSDAH